MCLAVLLFPDAHDRLGRLVYVLSAHMARVRVMHCANCPAAGETVEVSSAQALMLEELVIESILGDRERGPAEYASRVVAQTL